ncbi:MAG TPA: hypothetical protein VMU66_08575 [Gaiellales bacterium]|nr:hypothetical protein [Gaiellales bacterium]
MKAAADVITVEHGGRRGGHTWPGSAAPLPRAPLGRTSSTYHPTAAIWAFLSGHAVAD